MPKMEKIYTTGTNRLIYILTGHAHKKTSFPPMKTICAIPQAGLEINGSCITGHGLILNEIKVSAIDCLEVIIL